MPPNFTLAMRLPSRSSASMILPGTARHIIHSSPLGLLPKQPFQTLPDGRGSDAHKPLLLRLSRLPGLHLRPLVKTIARDELAHQAAFPEIDSALEAQLLRIRGVVHDVRRKPVQQFGSAPQLFQRKLDEDTLQLALAGALISREQPPAGLGEAEVHDAPVLLVLGAPQQVAPYQSVDRLTGGRVADPEKRSHIAKRVGIRHGDQIQQLHLRSRDLPFGRFVQQPLLDNVGDGGCENMRASQEIIDLSQAAVARHTGPFYPEIFSLVRHFRSSLTYSGAPLT